MLMLRFLFEQLSRSPWNQGLTRHDQLASLLCPTGDWSRASGAGAPSPCVCYVRGLLNATFGDAGRGTAPSRAALQRSRCTCPSDDDDVGGDHVDHARRVSGRAGSECGSEVDPTQCVDIDCPACRLRIVSRLHPGDPFLIVHGFPCVGGGGALSPLVSASRLAGCWAPRLR